MSLEHIGILLFGFVHEGSISFVLIRSILQLLILAIAYQALECMELKRLFSEQLKSKQLLKYISLKPLSCVVLDHEIKPRRRYTLLGHGHNLS